MQATRLTIFLALSFFLFGLADSVSYKKAKISARQVSKSPDPSTQLRSVAGKLPLESFESNGDSLPHNWTTITSFVGLGWQKIHQDSIVPGFLTPARGTVPPIANGGETSVFCSWFTGDADGDKNTAQPTEQFLITPQIVNVDSSDVLRFYLRYFSQFSDSLDILISKSTNTVLDSFSIVVERISFSGPADNNWNLYEYVLDDPEYRGEDIYIAFREHVFDNKVIGDALLLDLVEVATLVTNVEDTKFLPTGFSLSQNYPNPFNPSTTISFEMAAAANVTLKVYNLRGQSVAAILNNVFYPAGNHQVRFGASHLPNGVYFYRITAGSFVATRKMTVLK